MFRNNIDGKETFLLSSFWLLQVRTLKWSCELFSVQKVDVRNFIKMAFEGNCWRKRLRKSIKTSPAARWDVSACSVTTVTNSSFSWGQDTSSSSSSVKQKGWYSSNLINNKSDFNAELKSHTVYLGLPLACPPSSLILGILFVQREGEKSHHSSSHQVGTLIWLEQILIFSSPCYFFYRCLSLEPSVWIVLLASLSITFLSRPTSSLVFVS